MSNNVMFIKDVLFYLVPKDFFQFSFLVIILGLIIFAIIRVIVKAKPQNWEKKWKNGAEDVMNDLDAEHGSVIEISQAIATAAEKFADILPGILLILGLLGTFLGLGLSLNKASDVITQAKSTGMDKAMENMLSMLNGLGMNFITSIWGILGNLFFRYWISANGYDEKRLKWTITKTKKEIESRRKEFINHDQKKHDEMLNCYNEFQNLIIKTVDKFSEKYNEYSKKNEGYFDKFLCKFESAVSKQNESNNSNHIQLLRQHSDFQSSNENLLKEIKESSINQENVLSKINDNNNNNNQIHLVKLDVISTDMQEIKSSMVDFIDASSKNICMMQEAGQSMTIASEKIGKSAENLETAISNFENRVEHVLNDLKVNLDDAINKMTLKFEESLDNISKKLVTSTQSIDDSVNKMDKQVSKTLDDVGKSIQSAVDKQEKNINASIENMNNSFGDNLKNISDSLSKETKSIDDSVAKMDSQVNDTLKSVGDKIQNAVNDQKTSLKDSISKMDSNFINNLENMAAGMNNITNSISETVKTMNEQITSTLETVGENIQRSVDSQKENLEKSTQAMDKAINEATEKQKQMFGIFGTTSDTLNINVEKMTQDSKKVSDHIQQGLKAVSDSRRELVPLIQSLQNLIDNSNLSSNKKH